jgi:oligoendopeptidase F
MWAICGAFRERAVPPGRYFCQLKPVSVPSNESSQCRDRIRMNIINSPKGEAMYSLKDVTICLLGISLAAEVAFAQDRDRSKVPDKYKWNLADIYPSDDAWKGGVEKFKARSAEIDKFKGTLGKSGASLAGCFELLTDLSKDFSRLSVYAGLGSDIDTRDAKRQGMVQDIGQVGSDFAARSSFIQPEVLAIDPAAIERFFKEEPRLKPYRHDIDDILRRRDHTGTEREEKIIADAGLMADAPDNIYGIFSNAEFPFPEVTLSDGKTVKLDKSAFALYRAVPNREDRKKVFAAFFGKLESFRATFGTQLYAEVKKDMFFAKAHNYASSLASALDNNAIPVEVYKSLVSNVDSNLATFHRYLKLRQRMLGVDQLHYYDLYASVVKSVDLTYSYEDSQKNILAALVPLGPDYIATATGAFANRWLDVYPNTGKRSGAYSNGGAYDVHPYMLLNYNGKYDDMSTVAHELGHTMHSYYSNKNQPFNLAQYSIFVAEVASTFNEALLIEHMLKSTTDDNTRLTMLASYLDNIKGTVFRQTQFAEFELLIHEKAEKGESLTGEELDKLYLELTRRYYGHDKNICIVDDEIKSEWAYIPHFYYDFYVFQYATSFTASSALSEKVLSGDKGEIDRYLTLLKSGGSDYPINLLKKAGVDMTTAEPLQLTMKKMNRIMDEMEKILDKQKR